MSDVDQDARFYAETLLTHVDAAVFDGSGPLVHPNAPTTPIINIALSAYGHTDVGWDDDDENDCLPSDKAIECAEHLRAFVAEIATQAYIAGREAPRERFSSSTRQGEQP